MKVPETKIAYKRIKNDEFAGLTLMYQAIHGEDDKKNAPNPIDEQALINNFNAIYNHHQ